jgi:hypothetical protein
MFFKFKCFQFSSRTTKIEDKLRDQMEYLKNFIIKNVINESSQVPENKHTTNF